MKKIFVFLIVLIVVYVPFKSSAYDPVVYKYKNFTYTISYNKIYIGRYTGKATTIKVPSKIKGLPVTIFGVQFDVEGKWKCGFEDNKYVKHIVFPKSIKEIRGYSVRNCKKLKSVVIKGKVKEIEWSTFSECPKLKKIKLPNGVIIIDEEAFKNTGLSQFKIGKNVNSFSPSSIAGTKIKKISIAKGNKWFSEKKGVLYSKDKKVLCCYPPEKKIKRFSIPNLVKNIDVCAFCEGNEHLEKVVFSNSLMTVNDFAFDTCKKLKSVKFKKQTELTIGREVFLNCKSLKKVTIPKNVKKIGPKAFGYCMNKKYKYKRLNDFKILGYKGTAAEKYAKKNKFKFVALKKK